MFVNIVCIYVYCPGWGTCLVHHTVYNVSTDCQKKKKIAIGLLAAITFEIVN